MTDADQADAITFRWRVHFQLETGEWEWLTTGAKHSAGAKQTIAAQLDCAVAKWQRPTLTDTSRSLTTVIVPESGDEYANAFLASL